MIESLMLDAVLLIKSLVVWGIIYSTADINSTFTFKCNSYFWVYRYFLILEASYLGRNLSLDDMV